MTGAKIGIIAYGSTDPALQEARHLLSSRHQVPTDYLRLRALPIDTEVREFIERHPRTYVVEQNRDAQCASILRLECPRHTMHVRSVLHYSGMPIDALSIVEDILEQERSQ